MSACSGLSIHDSESCPLTCQSTGSNSVANFTKLKSCKINRQHSPTNRMGNSRDILMI